MRANLADWQRHQAQHAWLTWTPWASLVDLKPDTDEVAEAVRLTARAVERSNRLRRDPALYLRATLRTLIRSRPCAR